MRRNIKYIKHVYGYDHDCDVLNDEIDDEINNEIDNEIEDEIIKCNNEYTIQETTFDYFD